jgi:uncharacterized membrane protein
MAAGGPEMTDPSGSASDSTMGLDPNIASLLCYVLGFISGIVFLVIEKQNRDVRFHAYQSVATFLPLFVIGTAAGALPGIGWIVHLVLTPLSAILWIVLMVKAFQGERFKLPVVGDWAEQQAQ